MFRSKVHTEDFLHLLSAWRLRLRLLSLSLELISSYARVHSPNV